MHENNAANVTHGQLKDLREMPTKSRNPPKDGMDSVSLGEVYLKEWWPGYFRPACIHLGAMLCVAPGIWRSVECEHHCGAWWTP